MGHVLVAAWIGVMVGWIGFGWILAEAPSDSMVRLAEAPGRYENAFEKAWEPQQDLRVGDVRQGHVGLGRKVML